MKKRKNLGKKLVTMLVSVGFFAVLITALNLMALQAIRGKNGFLKKLVGIRYLTNVPAKADC